MLWPSFGGLSRKTGGGGIGMVPGKTSLDNSRASTHRSPGLSTGERSVSLFGELIHVNA